jgi:hypothetical protein
MARIAINAVIYIPADVRVTEIGCVIVPMASGALEDSKVAGIRMAGRTDSIGVPVIDIEPGVIERRSGPCRGCVAVLAGRREPGRGVVGIVRPLVICSMTAIAVGGETCIVVVHMTTGARNRGVGSGKRKRSVVVVKCSSAPSHGVVTDFARSWKCQLNVIHRCYSIVVVSLMTSNAGCARQAVAVVDVAQSTAHGYVRAG